MSSLSALVLQQAPRDVVRFHCQLAALTKDSRSVVTLRDVYCVPRLLLLCSSSSRAVLEDLELVVVPHIAAFNHNVQLTIAMAPDSSSAATVDNLHEMAGCHFVLPERAGSMQPTIIREDLLSLGISTLIKPAPIELGRLRVFMHLDMTKDADTDWTDVTEAPMLRVFLRGRVRLGGFGDL